MIKSITIFKKNGLCVFYKKFANNGQDAHLMSGFLCALNSFCNINFDESINYISTKHTKVYFRHVKDLIFAVITEKDGINKKLVNNLIDKFLSDFQGEKAIRFHREGMVPDLKVFEKYLSSMNMASPIQKSC